MRKVVQVLGAGALLAVALLGGAPGAARASGCARLSWGTCDPWVENKVFGGPGTFLLVYSISGSGDGNVGTDSQVRIRHLSNGANVAVPDAWRFDDAGCQAGQVTFSNTGFSGCPMYRGNNPLSITQYAHESDGSASIRLAITYDNFTPSADTRYTAWRINFQHTYSNAGPSPSDHSTCGGADECANFSLDFAEVLALTGQTIPLSACDSDASSGAPMGTIATWNSGCATSGPPEASTWGKVKGTYR
jgi:hypothetical protein